METDVINRLLNIKGVTMSKLMIIRKIVGYPFMVLLLIELFIGLATVYTFGMLMGDTDKVKRIVDAIDITMKEQNRMNKELENDK